MGVKMYACKACGLRFPKHDLNEHGVCSDCWIEENLNEAVKDIAKDAELPYIRGIDNETGQVVVAEIPAKEHSLGNDEE